MDDETLETMRELIYARVEQRVASGDEAWLHDKELLNLYLQLKILDELDNLYAELIKLNPDYK